MKAGLARHDSLDPTVAAAAICAMGVGLAMGVGGAAAASPALAATGGLLATAALVVVLAARWLPPLPVLALTLPLPALYGSGDVRIATAGAATAVVLFAWALGLAATPARVALPPSVRRATAALLAAIALAALFASARGAAARELVNFALLLGLLVVAVDLLANDRTRVRTLALTIAATAGVAGVPAALQAVGVLPAAFPLSGTGFRRATLGFGWPNELGMFFAVSLPLCWYAARTAARPAARALAFLGLGAAGLGLVATFSRGAWLAFFLSAAVLLLAGGARVALRVALGAVVVVAAIDLVSGGVVTGRLWSLADDPYVVQRAALMLVGFLMFRANPIVGVGPGGFREHLDEYGPGVPWLWDYVGSAHNAYLEIAAEAGILGLAAFVWFLAAHFRVLLRSARRDAAPGSASPGAAPPSADAALRRALLWSFTAACLACFTAWPFAHGIGQLIVLVAAMGIAAARAP